MVERIKERHVGGRLRVKCDGTSAETKFRLSAKRMSPFKWAGASVQSTTGRRAVHISLQGTDHLALKPQYVPIKLHGLQHTS